MTLSGKFSKSVSLLSWGYNEEGLIENFIKRAFALLEATCDDFEIVFVDDGSTDETGAIAARLAAADPRLRIIPHARNLNVGMASRTAIAAARKDILFWQTVDWSYDIDDLRYFLELMHFYDAVQGVRPVPAWLHSGVPLVRSIRYRLRTRSDTFAKAVVSMSNYYLVRFLFKVDFHDFQNVTFYHTRRIQALELKGRSAFVNPELLIRTWYAGTRFIEVPIPFIKRSAGEAKGTRFGDVVRAARDVFLNWWSWGRHMRTDANAPRIHRLAQPALLDEEVIMLCAPLFKRFREVAE